MNDLQNRWTADPQFIEMLRRTLDMSLDTCTEATRAWWASAPKVKHYVLDEDVFDFRCVPLDGQKIEEVWLSRCCLDSATARGCVFSRTNFQDVSARDCDFTGSQFIVPQMSRIFAHRAIFKDCVFDGGFLMGHHS